MEKIRYSLNEYLEKYLVFEVDFLTEDVKDQVNVQDDDCYMLCYGFCDEFGKFEFHVLAIGDRVDNCTKGLERPVMLKHYLASELLAYPFVEITPSEQAREKCERYLALKSPLSDDDSLHVARRMPFFDDFREVDYPDIVHAQLLDLENSHSIRLQIVDARMPGIVVAKAVEDDQANNVKKGDLYNIFPSFFDKEKIILAVKKENVVVSDMDGDIMQIEGDLEEVLMSKIEETLEEIKVRMMNKDKYKC
ncbi:MAG: hypothetical protein MR210_05030 [Erysipelotrichaceae bacterium]|nr:hypothetical protein [Erysipelotrichaceae bacterium]MDY5251776.1 hypothetical protein [Erysipelotrichaceae bacterium]